MSEMNTKFMAGQIHALVSFALACIHTHPAPGALRVMLEKTLDAANARALPEPVEDDYLEGLADTGGRLLSYAATVAAHREGR